MVSINKGIRALSLDVVFRAALGAGFAYIVVVGLGMPETGMGNPGLYPIFVGSIGLGLWTIQTAQEIVMALSGKSQSKIYDIAFETAGVSTATVWLRTFWMFGMMGTLLLGVWLLSFHVMIPLFLLVYLRIVGKTRWWAASVIAFGAELPIVLLYGKVINTAWPDSILEKALGIYFQEILAAPFQWLF